MATNKPAKAKREKRPADVIAQEALDRANRVVTAAQERLAKAEQTVADLRVELNAAVKKRDYAALNPDLPGQPDEPDDEPATSKGEDA